MKIEKCIFCPGIRACKRMAFPIAGISSCVMLHGLLLTIKSCTCISSSTPLGSASSLAGLSELSFIGSAVLRVFLRLYHWSDCGSVKRVCARTANLILQEICLGGRLRIGYHIICFQAVLKPENSLNLRFLSSDYERYCVLGCTTL